MIKRKRPTVYRVKASWVRAVPGLSVGQWLTVSKRVRQRRIAHKNLRAIIAIASEVRG